MLVRYQTDFQECSAQNSHGDERINVDESIICNEECVDLVDGLSKDTGKSRQINGRPSKRNVGKQGPSSFSTRPLEYRSNNNTRLRSLAPMNRMDIPSEQGAHHFERQTIDRICPGQASSRRASLPDNLFSSANMGHSISNLSPDLNGNASAIAVLPTNPQVYADMGGSVQHMKKEMKLDAPVSGLQTNQDTINLMKRPAEGSNAPQKKSRKTKSHNDVEESDRDHDYYSGSGEVEKKKEETFACPFYRKDPVRFLECINLRMVTISTVKQHLKRRHAANSHCPVCNKGFPSSKVFEDHVRKGSCSRSKTNSLDSIPPHILDALRFRSDRRMSSMTQWHEIWVLLFGESDTTPKPLLDGIAKEMTGIIRDIWSQDGNQIVSNYVQTRGLPASSGEMLSLLLELLDRVEDRFENKPLLNESGKQLSGIKRPLMEANIGARDDSRQDSATLAHYPYRGFNVSDFANVETSTFRSSDPLMSISVAEDSYDTQSAGVAFEPRENCSEYAASSFPAYTEPLLCMTVLNPTDHPYDIFRQGPLSQMARPEIDQDWPGLSDDYSLSFLEE
ncbi:hypothetical protein BFJ68_g5179 [Fusarium oxysporum]|uniref:C2H2-type domain-containing protein n=1 Tax=Fusarium oxysporum TaxID=5507 RepID=A0A420Q9L0_FUSOX|nr:hypothetical protein BFJ71_g5211 [Fusarium oxysporum]RKL16564.1 hypothetical protein BFJ68_g5179 [Fusarium oxysporum]